jgi:hypothetical protein
MSSWTEAINAANRAASAPAAAPRPSGASPTRCVVIWSDSSSAAPVRADHGGALRERTASRIPAMTATAAIASNPHGHHEDPPPSPVATVVVDG